MGLKQLPDLNPWRTVTLRPVRTCDGRVAGDRTGLHLLSLVPTRGTRETRSSRRPILDEIGRLFRTDSFAASFAIESKNVDMDHAASTTQRNPALLVAESGVLPVRAATRYRLQ